MKFKKVVGRPNYMLYNSDKTERFSYNPCTDCGKETAYVNGNEYFIKLGDFREEIEKGKNFNECLEIFTKINANLSPYNTYNQ